MISAGLFVALGLVFTWVKLPWKWRLWMNSNPVKMDLVIFTVLTLLHWGTFSGVMAATIGALTCSALLSLSRILFGYYEGKQLVKGKFNIKGIA